MHRPPPQPKPSSAAAFTSRWRKKSPLLPCSVPLLALTLSFLLVLLLIFLFYPSPPFTFPLARPSPAGTLTLDHRGPCSVGDGGLRRERFLWYAPHSGFSNQLSEFKNAVLFAAALNRTLVVPPVLDHHAVALGSCPKFRVTSPSELRAQVWDHSMELLRTGRYVAMTDIVDVSSLLSSGMVRMIDFRMFTSNWCGLSMQPPCFIQQSEPEKLKQCRSLLSGMEGNIRKCVYAVEDDCRTTVWTYKQNEDNIPDSFQPDEELQRKKRVSYVRKRRNFYNALGPGTDAEKAAILAFGTLFTAPYRGSQLYIDIDKVSADPWIKSLIRKTEFLPFVPEIITSGKEYASNIIREPFLCAQLRLLDGQFKNHWKSTFSALKLKLESLQLDRKKSNNAAPISIFIMTDLPSSNWSGSFLSELARNSKSFKIYFLKDDNHLVLRTARNVLAAQHGLRTSFLTKMNELEGELQACNVQLPDILLFLEEAICSCAVLGFVGTVGSTIAESIELMRENKICVI